MKNAEFPKFSVPFFHDIFIALISFPLALFLLGGSFIHTLSLSFILLEDSLFVLSTAGIFFLYGLYGEAFRYPFSLQILEHTKISLLSCLFYSPLLFFTTQKTSFPILFIFILWLVFFSALVLSRVLYFSFFDKKSRFLQGKYLSHINSGKVSSPQKSSSFKKNVLLIGPSPFLDPLLKIFAHEDSPYKVVGFLSETPISKKDLNLKNPPYLGSLSDISFIIKTLQHHSIKLEYVLAANPETSSKIFQFLLKTLDRFKIPLRCFNSSTFLPSLPASHLLNAFRDLTLEDLLEITHPSPDSDTLAQFIYNQRVLITGAGGSFGIELIRKIASLRPAHLSLLDHSEINLLKLEQEMLQTFPELSRSYLLCDVTDKERVNQIFSQENPNYVFHLAAIKHVPLAETNPDQAALTNILGTRNVVDASHAHHVKLVAFSSTTFSSHPSNILEATKRVAEIYCQCLDASDGLSPQGTRFIVCRFDNLVGTSGSLIDLFKRALENKTPLLLTNPEEERIFTPLKDAINLFLKACVLGISPSQETGHIYEIRIGRPMKLLDIANYFCLLNGLTPQKDVTYKLIGPRKGEAPKHFSSLLEGQLTLYKGLYKIKTKLPEFSVVQKALTELEETTSHNRTLQTIRILHYLVPNFKKPAAGEPTSGSKKEF